MGVHLLVHWREQEQALEPVIERLEINEERQIVLRFTPPEDISPGRYEVRVQTTSLSDDQPIQGEDKTISVEVRQPVRVLAPTLLAVALLGLVTSVVYTGVRLSRR